MAILIGVCEELVPFRVQVQVCYKRRMCNLYSVTTNVEAMRRLFAVDPGRDRLGNLPPLPSVYPRRNYCARHVRTADNATSMAKSGAAS